MSVAFCSRTYASFVHKCANPIESIVISYEARHDKTCLMPYANKKGVDQPAHPHSLIIAFVARCCDIRIHNLAQDF